MILSDLLWKAYQDKPDEIAITLIKSGQPDLAITYRQIIDGSTAIAGQLRQRGAQPGDVVIIILQHSIELIYAYFGSILLGAIPSIMPFLTEKLQPDRYRADLSALIEVTRPAYLITYDDFENEVRSALVNGDSVRAVLLVSDLLLPASNPLPFQMTDRSAEDIAILQHSSGTTGLQKGVALSHQSIINQLDSYQTALAFTPEDVVVSWLPLYHDMGLIAGFLMPVLLGARLILMSPFDWVRAPVKLLQAVSHYHGTLTWLPNFAYNFCTQKIRERELEGIDLSTWRGIINCSEPMRWESQNAFLQRFSHFGLNENALATSYAMAENVFAVTQGGMNKPLTVEAIDRDSLQIENIARPATSGNPSIIMLSAGQPINQVEIRILNKERQILPDRYIGEIAIKSNCMLNGYYHRPDLTNQAFYQGWYLTGDLGYIVNDELFITGRKKDIIIVGGKNIYPQDLELLAMEVPGVHMGRVSAFGVFNDQTGTEDVVIVAEVDTQDTGLREQIEDNIRAVISRGSAITLRNVYLVDRHWLIKTSSGKTARSANRDKYIKEISGNT